MTARIFLLLIALVFSKYTLACEWTGALTPGQTVTGRLSTADCISSDGLQYYDYYYYQGVAGEQVAFSLTSSGFHPSIDVAYIDPFEWVTNTSPSDGYTVRLPANGYFALPKNGYYAIYVWPQIDTEPLTGSYSLTLELGSATTATNVTAQAMEFYNSKIDHYFMTASTDEAVVLDNKPEWNWVRTGKTFNIWLSQSAAPSNASPVCRFFGVFANGTVGSHFYTVDATECAYVKSRLDWGWGYENDAFYAVKPAGGTCPSGTAPIYRAYNNGMGGAPNHRYVATQAEIDTMVAQGWVSEGTAICGVQ